MKKGDCNDGIPGDPYEGKICHPIPGGGGIDITVRSKGQWVGILHKQAGEEDGILVQVNIKSSKLRVALVIPEVYGRAIRCWFTSGKSVVLNTFTGLPCSDEGLQFVL